jgi:hypothetical protein
MKRNQWEIAMDKPPYTVLNVDISDDKEPILYIQRYVYPHRTYQVIRKIWEEQTEGPFIPDPAYADKYWSVNLTLTTEFDPEEDEELLEVFALIYLDEENPPRDEDSDHQTNKAEPHLNITYDPENKLYRCEPTLTQYESLEVIAEPSLRAAIDRSVEGLESILKRTDH